MIENVPHLTETLGTIAQSHSEIDGPTPNGQNTTPEETTPNLQSGFNALSGRPWANLPNGHILSTDNEPANTNEERGRD